jgi:hypothetical protein
MCQNLDLWFLLFYCFLMLLSFFLFALCCLFCVSFLLPFSSFFCLFFLLPFRFPPFSPLFLCLFFRSYEFHLLPTLICLGLKDLVVVVLTIFLQWSGC